MLCTSLVYVNLEHQTIANYHQKILSYCSAIHRHTFIVYIDKVCVGCQMHCGMVILFQAN